jgi:hypothetical protein
MRNLTTFLLVGVIFVSTISAQNTVVPIVKDASLLGGVQDGKWLTAEQTYPKLKDKNEFLLIGQTEKEKVSVIVGTKSEHSTCGDLPDIEFSGRLVSRLALGAAAKWNPVPRFGKRIPFTDPAVQKIAADFLKSKKIKPVKMEVYQSMRVDLDGDGTEEIILTADYFVTEQTEAHFYSDHSFVLLRKIVNGQPQTILIDGDFTKKFILLVEAIADLNGDGILELVIGVDSEKGQLKRVYEFNKNIPAKVLELNCKSSRGFKYEN